MERLELDPGGKTEVVKNFPATFPGVLTARGEPIVYTKENSENFEYIGMPVGGICAGQLYLGGDGKLWFWDLFNLNHRIGQLKGEEAYQYPYVRSRPEERGARMIDQGFSLRVDWEGRSETRSLDRDGFEEIEFLGQYPIGEVTYRDPALPVEVSLEAFSPFIPLDLENSVLPATILEYTLRNTSETPIEVELSGRLENAVLTGSRHRTGVTGTLVNRLAELERGGLRLECLAQPLPPEEQEDVRPDILFEDFERGYGEWKVSGDAFASDGEAYYHQQPLTAFLGKRLADSFRDGDQAEGKLTSEPFTIARKYVTCLLGGGNHPDETCLNIKVSPSSSGDFGVTRAKVVATATGTNSETLRPVTFDVEGLQGEEAVIEIIDAHRGGWGHVLVDQIVFTDRPGMPADLPSLPDFGTLSLAMLGGGNGRSVSDLDGRIDRDLSEERPLTSTLGRRLSLAPGASETVTFVLSWHFPVTHVLRGMRNSEQEIRYYAQRFDDAFAVSDYVIDHFEELAGATRLWRRTWYDSSLPYWFLDRTFLNASILASSTSNLLRDRLFYGWEGGYQGQGTCTHVWGYVHAMGRLFPILEKSLREQVDFRPFAEGGAMMDDGAVRFRWRRSGLAVDGQSGLILRTYLAHQMSADSAFLERNYAGAKKAMQGLTALRDADHDGILTGGQHNTLDADWYGKVTWLSLHYTAALRAMAEMADEMGDPDYAAFCRATADKGRAHIEEHLFNGEYFFHEADPDHPDSPGTYTGLEYSQLLGQSWAYQVGMGEIVDPGKASKALESMWRYNFTTDVGPFREVHKGGRWYAMPGEGGLIACTWPRGGSEVLSKGHQHFANYNNECQNGYEYAATSLMMWHGMPYHSLAHIWYMHNDRYHGSKRNPWCEVEWGVHYSRSMASYGHFVAACGFEYHGPKGTMAFAPKITPEDFKAPFTTAEGWGTFEQTRTDGDQAETITVKHGSLRLESLAFELPPGRMVEAVEVELDAVECAGVSFEQDGDRVRIDLAAPVVVSVGQRLTVRLTVFEFK